MIQLKIAELTLNNNHSLTDMNHKLWDIGSIERYILHMLSFVEYLQNVIRGLLAKRCYLSCFMILSFCHGIENMVYFLEKFVQVIRAKDYEDIIKNQKESSETCTIHFCQKVLCLRQHLLAVIIILFRKIAPCIILIHYCYLNYLNQITVSITYTLCIILPTSVFHHFTVIFILSCDDLTWTHSYMCNVVLKEFFQCTI